MDIMDFDHNYTIFILYMLHTQLYVYIFNSRSQSIRTFHTFQ